MNKFFTLLLLGAASITANAQTAPAPATQPYGKVDQADLEMKTCDFEKDANAEVLFDKGSVYYGADLYSITNEIHRRIKIFNDNGKTAADIHIPYYGGNHLEYVTGIQAQTINLVDGKVEITKLDKKLIYTKIIDKWRNEITFTMPNVKPGCIIEYKYNWNTIDFLTRRKCCRTPSFITYCHKGVGRQHIYEPNHYYLLPTDIRRNLIVNLLTSFAMYVNGPCLSYSGTDYNRVSLRLFLE